MHYPSHRLLKFGQIESETVRGPLKYCSQPNKVIIVLYFKWYRVQIEKYFPISSNFDLMCTNHLVWDNKNSPLTMCTFCKICNNFSLVNYLYKCIINYTSGSNTMLFSTICLINNMIQSKSFEAFLTFAKFWQNPPKA